jgi:hypothetical protein
MEFEPLLSVGNSNFAQTSQQSVEGLMSLL